LRDCSDDAVGAVPVGFLLRSMSFLLRFRVDACP
jgi:hypothetical protein